MEGFFLKMSLFVKATKRPIPFNRREILANLGAPFENLRIKSIESHVLHSQDTAKEIHEERNVGGHSGYFTIVRVQTEEGIDGWGECATGSDYGEGAFAAKTIIDRSFRQRLLGKDPREYRKHREVMMSSTDNFGRRDIGVLALSGVDTALVDITAKSFDVPVCTLLGGSYRNEIPLYASLLFDMEDPNGTAQKGKKYADAHYIGIKYGWGMIPSKPFGNDPKKDEAIVRAIRETLGNGVGLMVDVGRYVNLSPSKALQLAKRIEKYDITWLEEPLPRDDYDGYSLLTSQSPVPIAAGESYRGIQDFRRSILHKEVNLLQPDVSKAGGLSETKRIIDMAHDFNISWVPHNWSTAINSVATIHLVASAPDGYLMEFKQEPNPLIHRLVKHADRIFEVRNGQIKVPEGSGLGIEVDENCVVEFEVS
jgi:L-alanine-DL-glutamate epimerase-like enolase superfamily enzyme